MSAEIPIVCLMSTYREGKLPRGAIRSALKATKHVIVFEGLTEARHVEGNETDLGAYKKYLKKVGQWDSETDKRNDMLAFARKQFPDHLFPNGFWILILDADEILVWGEYLRDWLDQLDPGWGKAENVVPIKVTEPAHRPRFITLDNGAMIEYQGELWTDTGPSHLYHSAIIKRHLVGAWQIETPSGLSAMLDRTQSDLPPSMGEPHIHHRHYLRRHDRAAFRASGHEEQRWITERNAKKVGNNEPVTTLLDFGGVGMNRSENG